MRPSELVHIVRPDGSGAVFCDGPANIVFHAKIAAQLDYQVLCPKCAVRFEQYALDHSGAVFQEGVSA